jgi:hypothetical protein
MQNAFSYVTNNWFLHKTTFSLANFYIWDVADCSEMEQGELEVYWGQPFLVKSNLGYWDWPAGQKARLPHTQVQLLCPFFL